MPKTEPFTNHDDYWDLGADFAAAWDTMEDAEVFSDGPPSLEVFLLGYRQELDNTARLSARMYAGRLIRREQRRRDAREGDQ